MTVPTPIAAADIERWFATGDLAQSVPVAPAVKEFQDTMDDYYRVRLDLGDGWWMRKATRADDAVRLHNESRGREYAASLLAGRLPHTATVLDWGGGHGFGAAMLLRRRPDLRVVSVDVSSVLQRHGVDTLDLPILFIAADCTDPELFAGATFDAIIGFEVIEHFPNWRDALGTARRWLKPGGTLVLTTPNPVSYAAQLPDRPRPRRALRRLLGRAEPASQEAEIGERIYDTFRHPDELRQGMLDAGFAHQKTLYTQWLGEYPVRWVHRLLPGPLARPIVGAAEHLDESFNGAPLARRIGLTQVAIGTLDPA